MTPSVIVALIVAALIVVTIVGALWRRKRALDALTPGQREVQLRIEQCDRLVRQQQRAFDKRVRAREADLRKARTPLTICQVGSYPKTRLTEIDIQLNGRVHPLELGVFGQAELVGDVQKFATTRTSATRVIGGAIIAGPVGALVGASARKTRIHTSDTRRVYLTLAGPGWQEVVELGPHELTRAHQFVAALHTAAQQAQSLAQGYRARVAQAETALRLAQDELGPLAEAKRARELLGPDLIRKDRG